jgi:hypothetical protein
MQFKLQPLRSSSSPCSLPDRFILVSLLFQLDEVDAEAVAPPPQLLWQGGSSSGDAMLSDGPPQPEHFFQALESNPLSLQPTYFPIPAFNLLPELSKAVLNPLLPFVQIPYHGHEPAAGAGELLPPCVDGIAVALLLHWPERSARVLQGFLRVLLLLLLAYLLCLQCLPNCSSDKNGPV